MKLKLKLLLLHIKLFAIKLSIQFDNVKRFFRQLRCRHVLVKMSAKSHWKMNRESNIKVVCEFCEKKFYRKGKELLDYKSV